MLGAALGLLAVGATPTLAASRLSEPEPEPPTIHTDGRFEPDSRETIAVSGFPGEGRVEIAFFPTAICEAECGAVSRYAGRTDSAGSGQLHVRVPGYFFNAGKHRTPFLDRERLDLQVIWEGPNKGEFDVGSPKHAPVFRRPPHAVRGGGEN